MDIFTYEAQYLDLKYITSKLKTDCQQLDTIILQFNIYNYDESVDLTNFNIEFTAIKPDGTVYIQNNIIKSGNLLTISCKNELTQVLGRVNAQLTITDNLGNQKSSYAMVINVLGITADSNGIVSRNFSDVLENLNTSINNGMTLDTTLNNDILTGNELASRLETDISNGNTTNNTLVSTNSQATTTQGDLSNSIVIATELKDNLMDENSKINKHINDTDIHITKEEKMQLEMNAINIQQVVNLIDLMSSGLTLVDDVGNIVVDDIGNTITM